MRRSVKRRDESPEETKAGSPELDAESIQQGRAVSPGRPEGKGRSICTVAIPIWLRQGINAWMIAAGIEARFDRTIYYRHERTMSILRLPDLSPA